VVGVIDDQVHPAEADDLVQLVPALIDATELGHEYADLVAAIQHALGNEPRSLCHFRTIQEGFNSLRNGEDFGVLQAHRGKGKGSTKILRKIPFDNPGT
jgi:hypothetical protein